MPAHHAGGMGPKEALMQLASEAVRVAAQSPFLENAVGRAHAVLCCLYLPSIMQRGAGAAPGLSQRTCNTYVGVPSLRMLHYGLSFDQGSLRVACAKAI